MPVSLRSRLWLSYTIVIVTALSVVAVILFIYLLQNPLLYRQTIQRLKAVETVVMQREGAQPVEFVAQRTAQNFNVRILLYSRDRQLVLDTSAGKESALPFPQKRLLRATPIIRDETGAAWLYSMQRLPDATYLVIAAPRPRVSIVNLFTDDFLPIIIQSGLIALLLSLVVSFFVSRWIADPLQKVVAAARESQMVESQVVQGKGPQEVQDLTRAYNSMVARMNASQKSQRDFVANVSHELKTPLTSIQGFAQAILDGTADSDESRHQAAQIIYDESARMHRMVVDLLDLAKLDAGTADITMSSVHIHALLSTIAEKFTPQSLSAGVQIRVEAEPSLPKVTADGDRLAQVFTNLVDNALKFTPAGGTITLRADLESAGLLADSSSRRPLESKIMRVTVADTGAGISLDAQAHIFDRFYQDDPARKGGAKHGAGLGLAIAQEIIRTHGGKISVRSRLGEGTTFEVLLPLKR